MKYLDNLKETLMNELDAFAKKGDISISSLEKIHKLTDTIKNIDKICALEDDDGYSERYGTSYARGRGRYVKRDNMGRYSRDPMYEDVGASYTRDVARGYSRDEVKDSMMRKIGDMMEDADPKEREALKECMRAIERA